MTEEREWRRYRGKRDRGGQRSEIPLLFYEKWEIINCKSEINKKVQNVLSYEHCLINCRSEINEKLTYVFENVLNIVWLIINLK